MDSLTAGCTPARGGDCSAKTPMAHTSTSERPSPSAAPPRRPERPEAGPKRRFLIEPPSDLAPTSPSTEKARMLPSVIPEPKSGFTPSASRYGATRDPREIPRTTPTSEKTPARSPVRAPRIHDDDEDRYEEIDWPVIHSQILPRRPARAGLHGIILSTMNAAQFMPDVNRVLEREASPPTASARPTPPLTGSLVTGLGGGHEPAQGAAGGAQRAGARGGARPAARLAGDGRDEEVSLPHRMTATL